MKKLLLVLACLMLAVTAFGQWEAVEGPFDYDSYKDAVAINSSTMLTVYKGTVQKTVDFGVSWVKSDLPIALSANDMDSQGDVAVIVYDDGYIYKSTDAGDNWEQIGDTTNFTTDLLGVDVFNSTTYFVSGEDGLFMKTTDAGANWDTTIIDASCDIDLVVFTSLTNGVAFEDGNAEYWRTTDGGDTWTPLALSWASVLGTSSKRLYDVSAVAGENTIALAAYHNVLWLSTDGGATFTQSGDYVFVNDYHEGVKVFSPDSILVFTDDSEMLRTVDGGTTWDTVYTGTGQGYSCSAFSSMNNGILFSGYGQVLKTTDGATFNPIADWTGLSFWGIAFPAEGEVLVSAYGGGEVSYSADGESFTYPTAFGTNTSETIYELEVVGGDTVLMGGSQGLIKYSTDKGATWSDAIDNPMAQSTNKTVNMLYYANGKVFAGGSKGMIMCSTNNGETWTELDNDVTNTIYDMKILSNGLGLLSCSSGQICVSTSTELDSFMMSVDMGSMSMRSVDERNGVVLVGSSDGIWKTTTDKLDTLELAFDVPQGDDIYGVTFVDDETVYAVGQDGRIFVSEDTGATWVQMQVITLDDEIDLQHCDFDGEYFWAVGKNGTILKHKIVETQADYVEEFTDGSADLTWVENTTNGNTGGLNLTVAADSAGLSNVGIYVDDANTGLLYTDTGKKLENYEVSADIYCVKPASATEPLYKGLAIKTDPSETKFYRFVYRNSSTSSGALKFQGYNGTSWFGTTQWNAGEDFDTLETGFHNLKAQVIDNKFWLYIDGKLLPGCPINQADAPVLEAGYPGLYVYGGNVEFDNFKVNVFEYPEYNVTANVDMGIMVRRGEFNPASSALDIMGSFNGWSTGIVMTDPEADTIYTADLGGFEAGTTLEFKCRRNGAWDNTEEFYGGSNRSYLVTDTGDQVIPTFLYSDITEVAIDGVPTDFALEQNYPNPFNPTTTINFQIPTAEMVTMNIYDLSGRKVAEIFNAQMEAGYYNVAFDASTLASGMYIYRLTAGSFTDVRKMTLLK